LLPDQALTEAIEVVQLFNTVTKIADALQLQPDFNPRSGGRPLPAWSERAGGRDGVM